MNGCDVLVVGGGLAGLSAALGAAGRGLKVTLAARGAGCLAVSGACMDVLGYVEGRPVRGDPLAALSLLPEDHPYRLVGGKAVRQALAFFTEVCRAGDLDYPPFEPQAPNIWVPTLLGAFKPTRLYSSSMHRESLAAARRLILPLLPWLKDCRTDLAARALKKQKRLGDKPLSTPVLPNPWGTTRRDPTQLDLARWVDSPEGENWLHKALAPHAERDAAVLIPPVLGLARHGVILRGLRKKFGALWVEMLTPPPGVGGLRVRRAFLRALDAAGVELAENAVITGARTEGARCLALLGPNRSWEAASFIIATGGFLGGGLRVCPKTSRVRENIFDLNVSAPADMGDWSSPDVFASQPFSRLGVKVNSRLNPVSPEGATLLENVFFAGRTLAGYDFAVEKSGGGVALATGFHAAQLC